ncbi:hypothetical protein RhiirB3_480692 [Rhizophagus irregularis]|nr:hypothetical protein RhiirB3_480692 [Rhizophagus irregularis]
MKLCGIVEIENRNEPISLLNFHIRREISETAGTKILYYKSSTNAVLFGILVGNFFFINYFVLTNSTNGIADFLGFDISFFMFQCLFCGNKGFVFISPFKRMDFGDLFFELLDVDFGGSDTDLGEKSTLSRLHSFYTVPISQVSANVTNLS